MPDKRGDFIWYELMTSDGEAARKFYGELLGWSFADSGQKDIDYHVISMNGSEIGGLLAFAKDAPMPSAWMGYLCVDDVDASAAQIRDEGGVIHMEPRDIPGVGRFAFLADPQGVMIYVMTPTPPANDPEAASESFSPTKVGHCAWNELHSTDPDASVAFYVKHFGWRQEGEMDMGPMGKYRFFHHGSEMVAAVLQKMPEMPMPAWGYYFRVADIDEAVTQIKSGGGQVLAEPTPIPGDEFSVNALDPQGAAFGLIGVRS